jgi:hypothetical protein
MNWMGPFKINEILDDCLTHMRPWPEEVGGIYLISEKPWSEKPAKECAPLYVGSTERSGGLRERTGELIVTMLGFFGVKGQRRHSGGESLHEYCKNRRLNPKELYLGWMECDCPTCAEYILYHQLNPKLNRITPKYSYEHKPICPYTI